MNDILFIDMQIAQNEYCHSDIFSNHPSERSIINEILDLRSTFFFLVGLFRISEGLVRKIIFFESLKINIFSLFALIVIIGPS